jgi:hypothetical protein
VSVRRSAWRQTHGSSASVTQPDAAVARIAPFQDLAEIPPRRGGDFEELVPAFDVRAVLAGRRVDEALQRQLRSNGSPSTSDPAGIVMCRRCPGRRPWPAQVLVRRVVLHEGRRSSGTRSATRRQCRVSCAAPRVAGRTGTGGLGPRADAVGGARPPGSARCGRRGRTDVLRVGHGCLQRKGHRRGRL